MKRDGEYYGVPTAVRSLALFYNKKLFQEAGLDPAKPPGTLDEFVAAAEKTVKRDGAGNILSAGITMDMAGQDHQWWREVLIRQFGGEPYTDDDRKVTYDGEAGLKALEFYVDLQRKQKVGQVGFMDEAQAAFRAGRAAMTIDGTFRLGSFGGIKGFEWGVTELPANAEGKRSNYASYWVNAITTKAQGEKLDAAKKFLAYVTSPEAMEIWLEDGRRVAGAAGGGADREELGRSDLRAVPEGARLRADDALRRRDGAAPDLHRHGEPRPAPEPGPEGVARGGRQGRAGAARPLLQPAEVTEIRWRSTPLQVPARSCAAAPGTA